MAQSKTKKKLFNIAYNVGASIVILGALFKLNHISFGPLNGSSVLAVGLIAEAIIFFLSAFESVEDDLDWSKVYPELGEDGIVVEQKEKVGGGCCCCCSCRGKCQEGSQKWGQALTCSGIGAGRGRGGVVEGVGKNGGEWGDGVRAPANYQAMGCGHFTGASSKCELHSWLLQVWRGSRNALKPVHHKPTKRL